MNWAASIQVTEALKWIVGARDKIRRSLLSCDVWTNEWTEISPAAPRPNCAVCGQHDFAHLRGEGRPHITLCGRNSVQIHERSRPIDLAAMEARLRPPRLRPAQRHAAAFSAWRPHFDPFRRWPRHHPGNNRHRSSKNPLRAVRGVIKRLSPLARIVCGFREPPPDASCHSGSGASLPHQGI